MADVRSAVRQRSNRLAASSSAKAIHLAKAEITRTPGLVLDYLIVSAPLLNVDFGGSKVGVAAVGQTTNDYWNNYNFPGSSASALSNLKWSDTNTASIGIIVSNAPGAWGGFSTDV